MRKVLLTAADGSSIRECLNLPDQLLNLEFLQFRGKLYKHTGNDDGCDSFTELTNFYIADTQARLGTLGTLNVETDWDFALQLNDEIYSDHEFSIQIDSVDQLDSIQIMGPFGSPSGGKTWEIIEALKAIKANPAQFFSNQGGNRGAMWYPNTNVTRSIDGV